MEHTPCAGRQAWRYHPGLSLALRGFAIHTRHGAGTATILSEAAARGHTPILRLLLDGREPNLIAVQAAAFGGHAKAVRLLLAAGAPVDAGRGQTPLLNALHWSGQSR